MLKPACEMAMRSQSLLKSLVSGRMSGLTARNPANALFVSCRFTAMGRFVVAGVSASRFASFFLATSPRGADWNLIAARDCAVKVARR